MRTNQCEQMWCHDVIHEAAPRDTSRRITCYKTCRKNSLPTLSLSALKPILNLPSAQLFSSRERERENRNFTRGYLSLFYYPRVSPPPSFTTRYFLRRPHEFYLRAHFVHSASFLPLSPGELAWIIVTELILIIIIIITSYLDLARKVNSK